MQNKMIYVGTWGTALILGGFVSLVLLAYRLGKRAAR